MGLVNSKWINSQSKKIFDILEERESKVVEAMRYDNVYIAD